MTREEYETIYYAMELLDREGFVRLSGQVREAFHCLGGSETNFE